MLHTGRSTCFGSRSLEPYLDRSPLRPGSRARAGVRAGKFLLLDSGALSSAILSATTRTFGSRCRPGATANSVLNGAIRWRCPLKWPLGISRWPCKGPGSGATFALFRPLEGSPPGSAYPFRGTLFELAPRGSWRCDYPTICVYDRRCAFSGLHEDGESIRPQYWKC
jgi:hypothetical protein